MVTVARSPGRTGHRWRMVVAQVRAEEIRCWICGVDIDPCYPPRHPLSFSVDHLIPLALRPDLAVVRANLHAAHLKCNVTRSNRMRAETIRNRTSRNW